ncbi:MAG: M20 family metallopeptidase, partial [Oscillospiraceae bacterium]
MHNNNTDLPYLIETRRYLHRNPELSMREYNTAAFIRNELSRFGIEYRTVDETGTFARIDGKAPGKTVLLRADIDALPVYEKTGLAFSSENEGVMHACGHDFHTAALLGAAKELSALRDKFSGTVLLAFQQAEESQHGSKFFVREGLTKGYDRAFGIHISPAFPAGKIAMTRGTDAASCDYFKITLRGKSAHISKPHLGNDALAAAAELALKLPSIQPRILNPLDNSVIGIGRLTAGTSYNIIANEAVLEGTIRTLTFETQEFLQNKVRETAVAVAALYDVIPEVELETFAYPVIND